MSMIHIERDNIPTELADSNVFLYGGGYTGKIILDLFNQKGLKVSNIIDDDEELQGQQIKSISVISYADFCEKCQLMDNVSVVMTSIYGKAILKKLIVLSNIKVYEMFEWYSQFLKNNGGIEHIYTKKDLQIFKQKWELLRNKLADGESFKVIEGLWKYFDTKKLEMIEEICTDEEQYFIPEVLDAVKEPLYMVDGGAYRGELLQSLKNNKLSFEKWYCFEPDEENFVLLQEQAGRNHLDDRQICVKKGLWNKSDRLYFKGGNSTGSCIVSYETPDFVEVVSLDEYLGEHKCNFIKMDIEGAELPALKGAMGIIKRERPILTICIYHSLQDFWEIPQFLMNELENYKYYIRHHALICNETVLYAIPE